MKPRLGFAWLAVAWLLCACARTPPSADLHIDPNNLVQPYLGLGAQIWTGDTAWTAPLMTNWAGVL